MVSSRVFALTGPACVSRRTFRICETGPTYARGEEEIVPVPKAQPSSFSEARPEEAHINNAIYYVKQPGKPLSIWLVPEVAGACVFFETRHLMRVRNIYQCLRRIAQLIAKSNRNFVRTG